MLFAGQHHVGLQHDAFEQHLVTIECGEHRMQNRIAYFTATLDAVIAVDQHFRLHDRHDAFLLADRRIARQHFGVRFDAEACRILRSDAVYLAPLREAHAVRLV